MPADFFIGFDGRILELWYGRDAADHIPLMRIERFVKKVQKTMNAKRRAKLAKAANDRGVVTTLAKTNA